MAAVLIGFYVYWQCLNLDLFGDILYNVHICMTLAYSIVHSKYEIYLSL